MMVVGFVFQGKVARRSWRSILFSVGWWWVLHADISILWIDSPGKLLLCGDIMQVVPTGIMIRDYDRLFDGRQLLYSSMQRGFKEAQ